MTGPGVERTPRTAYPSPWPPAGASTPLPPHIQGAERRSERRTRRIAMRWGLRVLVVGGLIAFLFLLGRSFSAKRFGHHEATTAIVVSYYWHFVDVVWIALWSTIYLLQ